MQQAQIGSFQLVEGITDRQIAQLIEYSTTDPAVRKFSSDAVRFKDRVSFTTWQNRGRIVYTLVNKSDDLVGIVWFGEFAFPKCEVLSEFKNFQAKNYPFTFAIRLYKEARGKGLAKKVAKLALSKFIQTKEYQSKHGGFWLETSHDNIAAIKTYQSLFVQVSHPNEHGKIVMVLKNP
ncbi:MAG: hypothetical protein GW946_01675 [Candidatus Pacebacteria bacterium]|nr:hypothetical protein [Candidatus Paceibacterota bacterium]PIR60459.1 MAG: hypothetical protein COU67_01650 [Candidatus Pacebacteria bacterium CG10_big_fil_rev_8_21_14_0_10_44_54]